MKYKLYDEEIDESMDTIARILVSRGIDTEILEDWSNAEYNPEIAEAWQDLDNIKEAIDVVKTAIDNEDTIAVVVDSDADGFTSAAIFINYLYELYPEYVKNKINYYLHEGKQHGLSDMAELKESLIIVPDGGTNDYKQHKKFNENNQTILILDHHEAPFESQEENTITVNNQLSDNYENKAFSGAGIVYRFCQAYDAEYNTEHPIADEFLDLVALGNLSDMMDYRNLETRYYIHKGLQNIHNPFFYYMIDKNNFSIQKRGGINYNSIAWYVTPFINAIVRSGTLEEKILVFESMLQMKAFEKIPSGKRGHKGEMVPRVEEAVRIVTNVKARQTKGQDAAMELIENKIAEEALLDNAVILCLLEPGQVEPNLAGLVANKVQAKYQRPTLVLTKFTQGNNVSYRGSARNYGKSPVTHFKDVVDGTGLVNYAQGHQGAYGTELPEYNVDKFIKAMNDYYAEAPSEPIYWVDYIWTQGQMFGDIIKEIVYEMFDFWGQEIPESLVCVENIDVANCPVQLLSADKNPTLKIRLPNGVDIMKFGSSQEEFDKLSQPGTLVTIVGTPKVNEWNGNVTSQILIEDYEVKNGWRF